MTSTAAVFEARYLMNQLDLITNRAMDIRISGRAEPTKKPNTAHLNQGNNIVQ